MHTQSSPAVLNEGDADDSVTDSLLYVKPGDVRLGDEMPSGDINFCAIPRRLNSITTNQNII